MAVALLRGENLRLYRQLEIRPHPGLNLIVGSNAAGKTTLLEALFLAARGRSFRAQNLAEISGAAGASWNVFVETTGASGHRAGVGWNREGLSIRLDDAPAARVSDLARRIPMQIIDPLAHRLLDEGPSYRRSFVDWGVFHVEHRFLDIWRRFQRALKQRNAALRDHLPDRAIQAWNDELGATAAELTRMRLAHIQAAGEGLRQWAQRLLGPVEVELEWQQGWPAAEPYAEVLDRHLEQHRKLGTTAHGPHRAELRIQVDQARAKGRVSRGQQKLLVTSMVLAQAELLIRVGASAPIVLLDDFASELAPEFQLRLCEALQLYPGQKFVTAFEIPPFSPSSEAALFHVEHGTIRASAGRIEQLRTSQ
jgi:DNA replication and repair protein RecF